MEYVEDILPNKKKKKVELICKNRYINTFFLSYTGLDCFHNSFSYIWTGIISITNEFLFAWVTLEVTSCQDVKCSLYE